MHRSCPRSSRCVDIGLRRFLASHHPRHAGTTKYDTWRRLKKGLADVWAVRWMKKNWIAYEGVLEVVEAPVEARRQESA